MITLKKLSTLKERTKLRKISMILHEAAICLKNGSPCDYDQEYLNQIIELAGIEIPSKADFIKYEDISQNILSKLGAEPSDWDFRTEDGALDDRHRLIQDKILVLDRIRSPYNVGAIFRSADSFGIKKIVLVEGTASPEHVRAQKTSRGTTETVEWEVLSEQQTIELLKTYEPSSVMALELGGTDINTFSFPKSGVVVLGSEEFGISPEVLSCCVTRLTIAMGGSKGSLNVSVAAGILLQRWFSV